MFTSHLRIDINAPIDPETEQGILHYAAKNENSELVQWALDRGADADVKDKKGKLPSALLRKDTKLKSLLKHGIAQDPTYSDIFSTYSRVKSSSGSKFPTRPCRYGRFNPATALAYNAGKHIKMDKLCCRIQEQILLPGKWNTFILQVRG